MSSRAPPSIYRGGCARSGWWAEGTPHSRRVPGLICWTNRSAASSMAAGHRQVEGTVIEAAVKRTLRGCVPALVLLLAAATTLPATAQTWSQSAAAYERED